MDGRYGHTEKDFSSNGSWMNFNFYSFSNYNFYDHDDNIYDDGGTVIGLLVSVLMLVLMFFSNPAILFSATEQETTSAVKSIQSYFYIQEHFVNCQCKVDSMEMYRPPVARVRDVVGNLLEVGIDSINDDTVSRDSTSLGSIKTLVIMDALFIKPNRYHYGDGF